jgi:outer membrane protein TolC
VRDVQELEDAIKIQVRNALRTLAQTRESYQIQTLAETLAAQRVDSASLFLQAGRAQVRDVLDAQDDLVSAQNARISALVDYRIAELELQRDMGVIEVDHRGIWSEYRP